ncbi:uncharacterized protein YndB with AHSA1/START domain [Chitinophaga niastensis]|uniref:Uncharacterized protein YndB with AHSA1/START domain n=1 Tax=Chitinophaga niastensis TaxID=536980 RepID=A0A2P8HNZ2_CHINA|nr:SRPBCC family protein [Chitinophaga niastensis]PSL47931.1 uncharacterized protein YndB with AHSA1/START domain [Chitinophaga niastensis]
MDKQLKLAESIGINAPASKVWTALTDKALIKQYFFGTDVNTDWKKGSPITFSGEWEGNTYVEKGEILDIEKEKLLSFSYLSSGTEDLPQNYATIVYHLDNHNGETNLTVTQVNFKNQEAYDHSVENWKNVLAGLKKIVEAN